MKIGEIDISKVMVGSDEIAAIYAGLDLVYSSTPPTPTFQGKWLATYSDSHTESAQCDSSSVITQGEITLANLVSLEIGDCVTSIGGSVFDSCSSLTSVTIPSGVTSIDDNAFANCSSLTSITVNATTPPVLGGMDVFYSTNNCPIYVPAASVSAYQSASGWSNYASRIQAIPTPPTPTYETQYLTFVAETDNVSFTLVGANSSNVFQYSLDNGSTWNNLQIGQTSPSINTNEKILWKASGLTINQEAGIGTIRPSAAARVQGNIMSLCYSDNFSGQTTIPANFQFRKLFSAATYITSSENMVFPATTITKQAYSQMFQGCTAMTVAPKIIGTSAMTWSGDYCWSDMFHSCTSITTAPILPAETLGTAVYWYMFEGCTNLSNVTCLATSKQSDSTQGWLSNVASSGTFTKHPNATIWGSGANGIPNGWTVQDYNP